MNDAFCYPGETQCFGYWLVCDDFFENFHAHAAVAKVMSLRHEDQAKS